MESYALNIGVERNAAFAPDRDSVVKESAPFIIKMYIFRRLPVGGGGVRVGLSLVQITQFSSGHVYMRGLFVDIEM